MVFKADLLDNINRAVANEGVFDAHNHLFSQKQRIERGTDLFSSIAEHYIRADLASAGMNIEILQDHKLSKDKKWAVLREYLPMVRHTGSMETLKYGWQHLCGMNNSYLDDSNWREVDTNILKNTHNEYFTDDTLNSNCNIEKVVIDRHVGGSSAYFFSQNAVMDWYDYVLGILPEKTPEFLSNYTVERETNREYLLRSIKIDSLLLGFLPCVKPEIKRLLHVDAVKVKTLDEYMDLVDQAIMKASEMKAVALKLAMASSRSLKLNYSKPDIKSAKLVFTSPIEQLAPGHIKAFEAVVLRKIIKSAGNYSLPIQIHTGPCVVRQGLASVRGASADHMAPLIQEFPETMFVIFHAGWPYWGEAEQLSRRFHNVILDLSWCTVLSPVESIRMLESMFTVVPSNKFTWGADMMHVEHTYGSLIQAKRVVVQALINLITADVLSADEAIELSVKVFCKNAPSIYLGK